jgi:hypothetical protein
LVSVKRPCLLMFANFGCQFCYHFCLMILSES